MPGKLCYTGQGKFFGKINFQNSSKFLRTFSQKIQENLPITEWHIRLDTQQHRLYSIYC